MPMLVESPQARELAVKRSIPKRNRRALPVYSAIFPKIKSRLVRVIRYEVMTHCDWDRLTWK